MMGVYKQIYAIEIQEGYQTIKLKYCDKIKV